MLKSLIISQFAGPIIRHGATVVGGYLIAQGWADESTAGEIVGGLVAAGGLIMSWAEKTIRV